MVTIHQFVFKKDESLGVFVRLRPVLAKIVTVVVALVAVLVIVKSLGGRSGGAEGELEITNLTEQHKETVERLEAYLHDEAFLKARDKADKKKEKAEQKSREKSLKQAAKKVNWKANAIRICLCLIFTAVLMRRSRFTA